MTTINATLTHGSFGKPVSLDSGLGIVIHIPPGVELVRAELSVKAPDDTEELILKPNINTSNGKLDPMKEVDWISADWGSRRPVTAIQIDSSATKGRLKIADGGPWFPPLPFEFIPLGKEKIVRLSGVVANRCLVESVKLVNDKHENIAATFASIQVKVGARPPDLVAAINQDAPFYHHPLLLGPSETIVLRDELTSALQRAWPANLEGGTITVTLGSSAQANLQSVKLTLDTRFVIRTWENDAESVTFTIEPGDQIEAFIAELPEGTLQSFAFTLQSVPRPETVPFRPTPSGDSLFGHLVGSSFRAAQAFWTFEPKAALVGIDVYLQPLSAIVKGTVTIAADSFGRPLDHILEKAVAELSITPEGDSPWNAQWVQVDFPVPIALENQVFWAIVDIVEGEAIWLLGNTPEIDPETTTGPRGALYEMGGDRVWLERGAIVAKNVEMPRPYTYARPRFRANAPAPPPEVTVSWGNGLVSATIDEKGRVVLDADTLGKLARPADADKRIRISVHSDVGTTVKLSALEIKIPWSKKFDGS
ncbi:MAG TPA: hypothetical protein PK156_19895 [Polyangium sp.]|nr:hypothetical protein [Polyangium sp.]